MPQNKEPNCRSKAATIREQVKREAKRARIAAEAQQRTNELLVAAEAEANKAASTREESLKDVLKLLAQCDLSMGDLMTYFFDPKNQCERWEGFWSVGAHFDRFIKLISNVKNCTPSGKQRLHRWAVEHVKRTIHREAQAATRSRYLQTRDKSINEEFVLSFKLGDMENSLKTHCPTMLEVVERFATSTPQQRTIDKTGGLQSPTKIRKQKVVVTSLLSLLRAHNQYNNRYQSTLAIFMYASGLERQCFSVLAHLGVTVAYTSLVRSPSSRTKSQGGAHLNLDEPRLPVEEQGKSKSKPGRQGLLLELSDACRETARRRAVGENEVHAVAYDNINFASRENGTCATLFNIPGVAPSDLDLNAYHTRLLSASPLELDDLMLTREEYDLEQVSFAHTILGIVVTHGGDYFSKYRSLLIRDTPKSTQQFPSGVSAICPLPAMNINEGSVDGNIDTYNAIKKEISAGGPLKPNVVEVFVGDQLSMAHLRKGVSWLVGNERAANSLAGVVLGPGLFHVEMTAATLILENSWGKVANSEANPASLRAHNTLLGRKPIVLSSLPPFQERMDLTMVSLYARVMCTLPLAAGAESLEDYKHILTKSDQSSPVGDLQHSWTKLKSDAHKLLEQFTSRRIAAKYRREREHALSSESVSDSIDLAPLEAGDMVFESGIICLSDLLYLRNFVEAIRRGDSGRIVAILKTWTLAFRGSGHPKYAYEMLIFLHNYLHVWPPPLRTAIMNAWLVNTTGNPNSCIPTDLMQEHLNLQIKTIYKAHGSNHSWEWLSMISPCVHVLRQVARQFHCSLGDRQGTKHSDADLSDDIKALVTSMNEHRVYTVVPGRVFDKEDSPPKDVVSEGYRILANGSKRSIDEYSQCFTQLQTRFKVHPIGSPTEEIKMPPDPPSESAAIAQSLHEKQQEEQEDEDMSSVVGFEDATQSEKSEETEDRDLDEGWSILAGGLQEEDLVGIGFESDVEYPDDESESEIEESESDELDGEPSDDEMEYNES
ncbi:hypothetical protein BDV93DRAFT_550411 [Ceratobasidium sp. AG-I]|nr:hypothetical protein BDV93DRAFT_550411 [Ceratobasidium sp. AG-I]